MPAHDPLNILHVLRAPVGGLFRHVVDLARGQAARGHRVGVVADSSSGGARAEAALTELSRTLTLGLSRVAMSRQLGRSDISAVAHVARRARDVAADVIHGHGAKGGAYARLARNSSAVRVYTPHGGSLHYHWGSPAGFLYLTAERALMPHTDLFLFESRFGRDAFRAKVGDPGPRGRVVHNGVGPDEFAPIAVDHQATDLVFVGELRHLKGVDVLIKAIAQLAREGRNVSATIVGEGPDRTAFEADATAANINEAIRFVGAKPARAAFALGRLLIVPSRAESLPYVILEAAAAGLPLVATKVGGIPEILGPDAADLVPPGDPAALARAISGALDRPDDLRAAALHLQQRVRAAFSTDAMTEAVLNAYQEALAHRHG